MTIIIKERNRSADIPIILKSLVIEGIPPENTCCPESSRPSRFYTRRAGKSSLHQPCIISFRS